MFRPQIQKTRVLVALAIINLVMVYLTTITAAPENAPGYDVKMEAVLIDSLALDIIKQKAPMIIEDIKMYDLNLTGLITDSIFTEITTGSGNLQSKQTTVKKD